MNTPLSLDVERLLEMRRGRFLLDFHLWKNPSFNAHLAPLQDNLCDVGALSDGRCIKYRKTWAYGDQWGPH